ncbi:type II secretion system secretin GspD [Desulfogranum marinum]|uniref:type II secretion system secretin GspD n=1 Tax=Desulfogranum marinum TaxID=453220 RepID=UPI001965AF65|nr:type II secretion system secretin GspD [Desulfogranum marinum]MBM9511092.1 type II secretion system secretin GspD [Desulfogranum marinum]
MIKKLILSLVCLSCCLLFTGIFGEANGAPQKITPQRYVTIDFNDVDINLFIKYISELTGKNFIVDRAVKGNVTIISPTRISEEDAYRVFESVLEVHGFTTIPSGTVVKIVPAVQARSKNISTLYQGDVDILEDRVVTQIIPLVHSNADDLKKILSPLVSKTSVLIAHAESGMLIITDVQSNISRLMEIIKVVDVPSIGEETVTITLEHADAVTVAKSIRELFVQRVVKGKRTETIKIIAYERTNSLIIVAPKAQIDKIYDLLKELDRQVPRGEGKIRVYYLQHANAEEMVKVLTSLPGKQATGTKQTGGKAGPVLSSDIQVVADAETNALIITAPREEYLVLEDVIKKLDIPRRMVYMEALIMEVQVSKDFGLGVQYGGSGTFADETGTLFGGFSGESGDNAYGILEGLTRDQPVLPGGFTMGVLKEGIEIGGVYFPNLGAVINAYKDDEDINIIATPQILTTDNKKASIKVGENVPYITSKNTTTSQQDYTNYEYKDVATTLTITPQINQANVVRLEIAVEVIKLKDLGDGNPTTFNRTADTTVVVHNEETVVLGGIIGQDTSTGEYKVPLLGDIPLLGWLFKSRTESETKTNLFIFITPHIVENPAELAEIYYNKRDVMEDVQPGSSQIADDFFQKKPNPEHAAALTDLGFAKLQRSEFLEAKDYFLQALDIDPENPYATINLGVVYEREGNVKGAREMYQKVLELNPGEEQQDEWRQSPYDALKQLARENIQHLRTSGQ